MESFHTCCSDDETEYFIIETRCPSMWYPESQGTGLMVTRYAYSLEEWLADGPNNDETNKRGLVITADGQKINEKAKPSHLFGNGVNTISGLKYHSSAEATFTISNIQKNSDGSVSFDFDPGTATGVELIDHGIDNKADVWHDLQGRLLQGVPTAKGVYIHNGKKVVKK